MSTAVRAHRILSAMANYKKCGPADDWLLRFSDVQLGEPVGCYRNPEPEGELIAIFSDGLAWHEGGRLIDLRFSDVAEPILPNGKESRGLLLRTRDGKEIPLPIKGQHGRFFDSLEVLRFLDRVIQDLRSQATIVGPSRQKNEDARNL